MDLDERGETPFATDQSRHDVIHRAEHDHAEKGVETEVTVGNADLAELEITGERAQGNDDTEHAKRGVVHGTKNSETQCRAVTHERKIAAHGHVMIQANCRDWDDAQNHRGDAGSDHPGWERAIDEPLHSRPAGKERVSPEPDRRQVITVNRPADYFRDHVISGAEGERTEPKEKEIVGVPPIDRGLQYALHGHDKKHGLGS